MKSVGLQIKIFFASLLFLSCSSNVAKQPISAETPLLSPTTEQASSDSTTDQQKILGLLRKNTNTEDFATRLASMVTEYLPNQQLKTEYKLVGSLPETWMAVRSTGNPDCKYKDYVWEEVVLPLNFDASEVLVAELSYWNGVSTYARVDSGIVLLFDIAILQGVDELSGTEFSSRVESAVLESEGICYDLDQYFNWTSVPELTPCISPRLRNASGYLSSVADRKCVTEKFFAAGVQQQTLSKTTSVFRSRESSKQGFLELNVATVSAENSGRDWAYDPAVLQTVNHWPGIDITTVITVSTRVKFDGVVTKEAQLDATAGAGAAVQAALVELINEFVDILLRPQE